MELIEESKTKSSNPNQTRITIGNIIFSSEFDSGNLRNVVKQNNSTVNFNI